MKYYYEPTKQTQKHGRIYRCDHPFYSCCTLYLKDGLGLAVVMKYFDDQRKTFYYDKLPACLANDIYKAEAFPVYFKEHAKPERDGLYPTVTARSIMWALRMRPLKKEWWESKKIQSLL